MATELKFTTRGGSKEYCEITPSDSVVVQIQREDKGYLTVYANLEGMEPTTIFSDTLLKDYIFNLDVPEGVTVTIESASHVLAAKMS